MGKPIKLEKNQRIVTEAQYTVAVHLVKSRSPIRESSFSTKIESMNKLGMITVRADSEDEAVGMVLKKMCPNAENFLINGWLVNKTGD